VGTEIGEGVAEGGNQMMVAVGTGVSVGRGVEVAGTASTVRQELTRSTSARRSGAAT
jgi:hypothetical protein